MMEASTRAFEKFPGWYDGLEIDTVSRRVRSGGLFTGITGSHVTLSAELIDRIIDFLWDDPQALFACARTCRQWLPSSVYHLYDDLCITSRKSSKLLLAAASSPSVASGLQRARSLRLIQSPETYGDRTLTMDLWPYNILAALSSLCPNIISFSLGMGNHVAPLVAAGYTRSPRPDHLTLSCLNYTRVTHLDLRYLTFQNREPLWRLLCGFPALSSVELNTVTVNSLNVDVSSSHSPSQSPALLHLGVIESRGLTPILSRLREGPSAASMRSLSMSLPPPTEASIRPTEKEHRDAVERELVQWIRLGCHQLEKLALTDFHAVLDVIRPLEEFVEKIGIPSCTALRSLELSYMSTLQVAVILQALSLRCRIETLILKGLNIVIPDEEYSGPSFINTLAAPQFSELRYLHVHVRCQKEEAECLTLASELRNCYRNVSVSSAYEMATPPPSPADDFSSDYPPWLVTKTRWGDTHSSPESPSSATSISDIVPWDERFLALVASM